MSRQAMIDLFTRLAQDRKESQKFQEDPDRVMNGLDLTDEEKNLLKRAQREEIREYLGQEIPFIWFVFPSVKTKHSDEE